jgi:hypothetical protein
MADENTIDYTKESATTVEYNNLSYHMSLRVSHCPVGLYSSSWLRLYVFLNLTPLYCYRQLLNQIQDLAIDLGDMKP